jgi:hypothetical protein
MNFMTSLPDAKCYLSDRRRHMLTFILKRLMYTAGTEKSVHSQNHEVIISERVKTNKIRSGRPEGVQCNRLII